MKSKTTEWFELAIPNPTKKNAHTQLGVHIEEFAEMCQSLKVITTDAKEDAAWRALTQCANIIADALKKGEATIVYADQQGFLDSLCDQHVTITGLAHIFGFDFEGAIAEVDASNFSKFKDGKPIFDENGKIAKNPETYFKPDLTPFLQK
jgi:hypothetical protein